MPTTATYTVNNPTPNTVYYAPSAYWFVPDNNTTVTVTVQTFDASGNLVTESSTTAYIHDQTTGVDKASFTFAGGNTVNAASNNGTNGADVFTSGGATAGSPAKLKMYASYTGHSYNSPPNAPSNMSPTGGAVVNTLTPTLAGSFTDPDAGNTLGQYEILVRNAANGGGAQIWDSGIVSANASEISAARFSRAYAGPALAFGTTYSWAARVADQSGAFSVYSGWQNFTPTQGPNAPSAVTPSGVQATLTPAFSFGYSSPTALGMASYHYVIATPTGVVVYDSGGVVLAQASGTTVSGTIPSAAGLGFGQSYVFAVNATDTNSATSPNTFQAFSIAALPTVALSSPINNVTVNSQTPTFAWAFNDPNFTQQSFQVRIYNDTTGALIKDTGVVASAATSYLLAGTTIAFGTRIHWQVQVVDTAGLASGFSAFAFATVNNTPQVAITSPTNGAIITTSTPTITWTYTASAGGQLQASFQVVILDAAGVNTIYNSGSQAGAGTSFVLPAGILQNTLTYLVRVLATDTAAQVGQATNSFTLQYTPPADMQGQALATAKNYVVGPYLNTDGGTGAPTNWSLVLSAGVTATASIDPNIVQPVQKANGDGFVTGAAQIAVTNTTGAALPAALRQNILVATAGWTAGVTVLSMVALCRVSRLVGAATANVRIVFYDAANAIISFADGAAALSDTAGAVVRLTGPQNVLIPANCVTVQPSLRVTSTSAGDTATVWWMEAQLEAAAASDAAFIAGDLGTGFSYDVNLYSLRTQLAGNLPAITANPGSDTDPITSQGGSITLSWDTTLADATRFTSYLIDRRRSDQQTDDSAWLRIATLTNKTISSFTDLSAGSATTYEYSVRQQILYVDGAVGVSAHRAIVTGSVSFSPAWYLTNLSGLLYNLRLLTADPQRAYRWQESAQYSQFMGRLGMARDSGPDKGYAFSNMLFYWNSVWGDDIAAVRRLLVQMQRLNALWYLKDPRGLVVPVYLSGVDLQVQDSRSDQMLIWTASFQQAQDTQDY